MRVHHLALRTKQLRKVVRFYRDVLGLPTLRTTERSVWLEAGGTIVMIETAERSEPAIPAKSAELVAFGIHRKDLAKARERLVRHRVRIEAHTDYTFYFRDPDGRRVAISSYPRSKITGRR